MSPTKQIRRRLNKGMKVFYLCDGEDENCERTDCYKCVDDGCCRRTSNIRHALHFHHVFEDLSEAEAIELGYDPETYEEFDDIPDDCRGAVHKLAKEDTTETKERPKNLCDFF